MKEYLQSTPTINCDDPKIIATALEIAGDSTGDEETARRCFFWVRDSVRHSIDHNVSIVTCTASDVLEHRAGFCYAKSHLLVALLRSLGIPAALSYQRLSLDSDGSEFYLHGLVSIYLEKHGWYRVDPRGDKAGVVSDFCPPTEKLPFTPRLKGERDVEGIFADAMSCVVSTLKQWTTADDVRANLPTSEETE